MDRRRPKCLPLGTGIFRRRREDVGNQLDHELYPAGVNAQVFVDDFLLENEVTTQKLKSQRVISLPSAFSWRAQGAPSFSGVLRVS
jgi:hypothetical protein